MLILKYFLTVGFALTAGLFVLSAYMESESIARAARTYTVHAALPVAQAAPLDASLDVMVGPIKPDKLVTTSTPARHGREHRRSVR
jgi:hypothetical protein